MKQKQYTFSVESDSIQMDKFIKRYHFDEKDKELLCATGHFLAEMISVEAGILYLEEKTVCVATLGSRFDRMSDVVAESEHLLLAYSMECFGMEFLSKAYEKMNEMVFQETGKWMGEYIFLGEENLEEIREGLDAFSNLSVTWKNGMLRPLKSVIFTAKYKEKREDSGCHNCEQCNNVTCSFREGVQKKNQKNRNVLALNKSGKVYSYGISRILGDV